MALRSIPTTPLTSYGTHLHPLSSLSDANACMTRVCRNQVWSLLERTLALMYTEHIARRARLRAGELSEADLTEEDKITLVKAVRPSS